MLENNADRSWFMIGAIILGGGLIAAALILFKDQLWGEGGYITDLFSKVFGNANDAVDGIGTGTIMGLLGACKFW